MTRVAWLTDIHLNFLRPAELETFLRLVAASRPDTVLVGGDIGEAPNFARYLVQMARAWPCLIYFVLGNHDYYKRSIASVRSVAEQVSEVAKNLVYLTACQLPIALTPHVGLVGHDGWGDGRAGDYARSDVMLNDYLLIEELAAAQTKERRLPILNRLGDEAAEHARRLLPAALEQFDEVLFLTHVPPFLEACWHDGRTSDANWSPHFTCLALGEALAEIMDRFPQKRLTVLCGHTHSSGVANIRENLTVLTGQAEYGKPEIQRVLEFE